MFVFCDSSCYVSLSHGYVDLVHWFISLFRTDYINAIVWSSSHQILSTLVQQKQRTQQWSSLSPYIDRVQNTVLRTLGRAHSSAELQWNRHNDDHKNKNNNKSTRRHIIWNWPPIAAGNTLQHLRYPKHAPVHFQNFVNGSYCELWSYFPNSIIIHPQLRIMLLTKLTNRQTNGSENSTLPASEALR